MTGFRISFKNKSRALKKKKNLIISSLFGFHFATLKPNKGKTNH